MKSDWLKKNEMKHKRPSKPLFFSREDAKVQSKQKAKENKQTDK